MNNLTFENYLHALRTDPKRCRTFTYLTSEEVVHHIDHDIKNNELSNLQLTNQTEHARSHDNKNHVLEQVGVEVITDIKLYGEEPTYDISIEDDPHNFVANGFVVHNTGKTKPIIDYMGLLWTKRGQVDWMVTVPLNALDTWPQEFSLHLPDSVPLELIQLDGRYSIATKIARIEALAKQPGHGKLRVVLINHDAFASKARMKGTATKTMQDGIVEAIGLWQPDGVTLDECHPDGTMIATPSGEVPIETLKVGDEVLSFSDDKQEVVTSTVTHTFNRLTEEPLYTLGEMRATPYHPVWTQDGYIPIKELRDDHKIMRMVWDRVPSSGEQEPVLFSVMLGQVEDIAPLAQRESSTGDEGSDQSPRGPREAPGTSQRPDQPVPGSRSQATGSRSKPRENRMGQPYRRQWPAIAKAAANAVRSLRWVLDRGVRCVNGITWRGDATPLQNRHCQPRGDDRDRGRWGLPSITSGAGPTQRRLSHEPGMDSAEVFQQGGNAGSRSRYRVHNIETGVGNFFADGILVHNSHRLKSHTANRAVGLRRVGEVVAKRQILTGTVSPKNPLDIYSQWKFLNPERFDKRWADFCRRYAVWGGFEGRQPTRFVRQDQMREKIKQDAFIATKEQCLDLPATTDRTVPVDLGKTEANVYRELGQHLMAELPSGQTAIAPIVLTKVLRLRQVTGGFLGYEDDHYKQQTEELGTSKLDVLADLLKDLFDAQEKVVIYAHFRPDIQRICNMLARRFGSTPTFRVEGQTAHKARLSARQGFAATEGAAAMVAQQRTMSLAVNELVASSHAVFYSLSERRDDYDQAKDRLHRQGQTRPVTFHHLVVPNSVDTMLLSAHRDKIALENALLQDQRALTLDGQ